VSAFPRSAQQLRRTPVDAAATLETALNDYRESQPAEAVQLPMYWNNDSRCTDA